MLKEYKADKIRNVAIIGHGQTGKSTLFDAMLFVGGKIQKIGSAESGTLTSDFDEEEKARKISIRSSLGFVEIGDVKINIIDTPGTSDFLGEARAALQVAEAAILVVDSVDGIQIETEKAWRYLNELKLPRIIFVNKMDKERANFATIMTSLKASFKSNFAPVVIPFGEGEKSAGVIDLADMKLITPKGDGRDVTVADIPADLKKNAEAEKNKLVELAAEGDDKLIEKFLEGGELSDDEVRQGIRSLLSAARLHPVVCGSGAKAVGVKNLLNVIKEFVPAPATGREYMGYSPHDKNKAVAVTSKSGEQFAALIWKTYIDQFVGRLNYIKVISGELSPDTELYNASRKDREKATKLFSFIGNKQHDVSKLSTGDIGVLVKLNAAVTRNSLCDPKREVVLPLITLPHPVFSYAITPVNKADSDKIAQYFNRIVEENPTITYMFNAETKESVLAGMGEMQLGIILHTLKEKNKIEVITREPRVAYRETITKKAEAQYKHKKQTGGHGQYGEVYIRMAPLPRGQGYEFKDSIVGGVIPRNYIPGIEKGIREALDEGTVARFPVVDVWVELYYGSYHPVDSSELSFKLAARNAFKNAMEEAGPILLEPIMEVSVFADKEYMGDILNGITGRRGRILGMESADETGGSVSVVKATAPLAEMLRYSIDLRAMTSGKGTFEMKFSHYDPISGKIAEKVIEDRKKQLEDEANK